MFFKSNFKILYFWGMLSLTLLMMGGERLIAGNQMNVSSQQPQILPSFNTLGFQISFSGDDNKNGSTSIKYRESGGSWHEGHPCVRVWYSDKYEWAGRIFHLKPGASYEVEVTFDDPDGVTGQNPLVFTATSRSEPVIMNSGGKTYHVSPSGNDSNSGSQSSPFQTIEKAIGLATAGCTIVVHGGTYRVSRSGRLRISQSGTAESPIIIKAAEGEEVIIDSYDSGLGEPGKVSWRNESSSYPGVYSASCEGEPYLVFYKGHYLCPTTSLDHLADGKYKHDGKLWDIGTYGGWYYDNNRVYIKFPVTFRNWSGSAEDPSPVGVQVALSEYGFDISGDHAVIDGFIIQHLRDAINISGDYVVIRNTQCRRNKIGIETEGSFTLIDHCEIGCSPTYWYREWELGHDRLSIGAVSIDSRDEGNCVVRNSRIYGVENGLCCDSPWSSSAFGDPSYSPGTIIMNNEFDLIGDDAIETDGPGYNYVIYGNYFHHCYKVLSSAPLGVGPIWVMRNMIYLVDRPLPGGGADDLGKYGGAPYRAIEFSCGGRPPRNGRMLLYHNTSLVNTTLTYAPPFCRVHSNAPGFDVVLRNNSFTIKQGTGAVFQVFGYASGYTFNLDIDYDNLWRNGEEFADVLSKDYNNLSELQADGYELHGLSVNPDFVNLDAGDFRLPEGSPLIDAGVPIPGINDGYTGNAPDIGVLEYGQASPVTSTVLSASLKDGVVELEWSISSDTNISKFIIERSPDNSNYKEIGHIKAKGKANSKNYKFIDKSVTEGKYYYRIKLVRSDGSIAYSPEVQVIVTPPVRFTLRQNYPNPFNPRTEICYDLPYDADVHLAVFNELGQHVRTVVHTRQLAGQKVVEWNGLDDNGFRVATGIYLYRLTVNSCSSVKKMMLLR